MRQVTQEMVNELERSIIELAASVNETASETDRFRAEFEKRFGKLDNYRAKQPTSSKAAFDAIRLPDESEAI